MKHKTLNLQTIAVWLFILAAAGFFLFFFYLSSAEALDVYDPRVREDYNQLTVFSHEEYPDDTAPAGMRHVYRWNLSSNVSHDSCLCILTAHQTVQVQIGDEWVYRMAPEADNRISQSSGTHWSTIPLYPQDAGKEITVTITPLFPNVTDYGAEFWQGPQHSILFDKFSDVLPQLLVSVLCMMLGICILVVQAYFNLSTHTRSWDMFYLGSFSFLLGLWYLTFHDPLTILYPTQTISLQYITIGSLFLLCIPLGLYAFSFFRRNTPLLLMSILSACTALAVLLMQLLGIRDMKENLTASHIMLILTVLLIFLSMIFRKGERKKRRSLYLPFLLLALGVASDLVVYSLRPRSAGLMFSVLGFVVFTAVMFGSSIIDVSRRGYRDANTGLPNRLRWNELMQNEDALSGPYAVLIMDLNGLKMVNDTLGHEAGDRMIFSFANILRNTLPHSGVICRWGGDEFAALLTNIRRDALERNLQTLNAATEEYNNANPDLPIHFSIGYALSEEHPETNASVLFKMADANMYLDKQAWYARHGTMR